MTAQALAAELKAGITAVGELGAEARRLFWSILGPAVRHDVPESVGVMLDEFAKKHGEDPLVIARAVKAWRHVLRIAHEREWSLDTFVAEIGGLVADPDWVRTFVEPAYTTALQQLEHEAGYLALLEHGRLLVGADFRVDSIEASQRGRAAGKVAVLTLRTREGKAEDRYTVVSNAEGLTRLKDAIEKALSRLV